MAGKFYNLLKEIYIIRTIKRSGLFDREYYLKNNLDVARSCMNPIRHYVRHGWKEERNPNQNFDTKWYLTNYPDVAASGMNPFYHYCKFGIKEERNSSDHIDSKINPLVSNPESGQYQNNRVCSSNYRESEKKLICKVHEYNEQKLKRKAKVVVYTAITGNYDSLIIPEYINKDWDYVCFSDDDIPGENIYEIRRLDSPVDGYRRSVRYVKTQPHLFFPDYEYSIWIDANILVRGNHLENAVKDGMERNVLFMGCRHPFKRGGIYDELAACILGKKDDPKVMIEQVTRYIKEGFPGKSNFLAGGLIIRKHNDYKIASFGEHWWLEIAKGSFRDQLSLMYVIWKQGLDYEEIPNLENIYEHSDYCVIPHLLWKTRKPVTKTAQKA